MGRWFGWCGVRVACRKVGVKVSFAVAGGLSPAAGVGWGGGSCSEVLYA